MQRTARLVAADSDIFALVSVLALFPVPAADSLSRVALDTECPTLAAEIAAQCSGLKTLPFNAADIFARCAGETGRPLRIADNRALNSGVVM